MPRMQALVLIVQGINSMNLWDRGNACHAHEFEVVVMLWNACVCVCGVLEGTPTLGTLRA